MCQGLERPAVGREWPNRHIRVLPNDDRGPGLGCPLASILKKNSGTEKSGWAVAPIDQQLPNFDDKDLILATLQLMWVATQEYPASPPSLASQSVCLDLDAISSGDSEVSNSGAPCFSPVFVVDQQIAVISVHSSDTDPDSSDEGCLSDSQSEPVSPRVLVQDRPASLVM